MAKIFYTTLMKQKNTEPYLRINSFFFFLEKFYLIITFCEVILVREQKIPEFKFCIHK